MAIAKLHVMCISYGGAGVEIIEEPRNARSRRTAAALLRGARELIEQEGFAALTMAAVAARAGVSRRAVYLHFATRTELLAALYRGLGETDDLARSLQAVWDCPDAVAALTEWARHIARSHPRILGVLRAVERARYADPDAAELWQTAQGNWLKGCRRLMCRLADDARLAAPWTADTAADMMWALMSIDVLDRLLNERRWSQRRVAEHLAALFRATFVR
jgi:AcrR family transcriptional regulator